jgi:lysine 6-dehydrogenase
VKQLRVAVLGAAGTIAPAILADLAVSDEVLGVLALDLDAEKVAAVAAAHGGAKTQARAADATAGLADALAGVDLLINAASYRVNLDAMRACLAAGCHYFDLGGLYHVTREQLELHSAFAQAGLLALLGIGSSPGKTNLMALRAVRELDTVESIDVFAGGRDPAPRGAFAPPYALQTLLDELTLAPVVLRDGVAVEIAPLTSGGAIDYGEPIGVAETIYTLHSELASFGQSFGCAQASFRQSLAPALEARLRELTAASASEIKDAALEASPASDQTVSVHLIVARGGGRVVRVRARTGPHRAFGIGGSIISTAAPAVAATRLLARGAITAVGALPPEQALMPEPLFAELETRSCQFCVEIEEGVP